MLPLIIRSLRPYQWMKNLIIFAPLIFSLNVFEFPLLLKTAAAFGVFCLLSGAAYLVNDIKDIAEDKIHPKKRLRPLASGRLSISRAVTAAIVTMIFGLGIAGLLDLRFLIIGSAYILLQLAYSFRLKHIVILDIFTIAAGFIFRVIAGGMVIDVGISPWLLICTGLLAFLLALGKRRHELVVLDEDAARHRPSLNEYSIPLLDQMISVVTASTVMAYCLYTISGDTAAKFGTGRLIYTVPFVLYGLFRFRLASQHCSGVTL